MRGQPGAEESVGDTIFYRDADDQRSVVCSEMSTENHINIRWDAVTRAGSIQADDSNNGATSCWSAAPDLDHIACLTFLPDAPPRRPCLTSYRFRWPPPPVGPSGSPERLVQPVVLCGAHVYGL